VRPFAQRRILLGVTGGIAAYKSIIIARQLTQAGAAVDVVLTQSAQSFVGALSFEAVTGRPVHTALVAPGQALTHIALARSADAVVVAPATAEFLANAVHGHAGDLLLACLLATEAPVMLAPAMNDRMWAHPAVTRNVLLARELGYHVVDPDVGPLAAGEGVGPGRLPEPESLMAHIARLLSTTYDYANSPLAGAHVVVTAGPTREAVDPVRFLSNRSSGRMGVEIAAAAWRRGARVVLIAGPLEVPVPDGVTVVHVESTAQMEQAVREALPVADALIMAAAPADFTVRAPANQKLKKREMPDALSLVGAPDILLQTREARSARAVVVGFALETEQLETEARRKLTEKGLDLVVANDATEVGAGFASTTNRVTLIDAAGRIDALPLMSKRDVAEAILDRVEVLRRGR
jgi:phosphopantothenoylcysteine decarboxylase/phosphopantothenate--cysteine ligase